jgi:hypothetical protein
VDRNLMLYLPRLAVLATIEADRPGAWFPGPLGLYQALIPGICLSRDFKHAKVPVNPMKTPFCFSVFWGAIFKKTIFKSRQPNDVQNLLSGLYNLLKYNFDLIRSPPGDPRVAHCSHFSVRIMPPDFVFFPVDRNQRQGPAHRGVVTRH